MPSFINSTMKKIWKKMERKAYRDGYVAAHVSNTVASQILLLRTAKGWTQVQLAEHAGMRQSRISSLEDPNWENVEVATLRRLASAFDVALTVRFTSFSELAGWSATLSEHKLAVPTYDEEAETIESGSAGHPGAGAAATGAFLGALEQRLPQASAQDDNILHLHAGQRESRPSKAPPSALAASLVSLSGELGGRVAA